MSGRNLVYVMSVIALCGCNQEALWDVEKTRQPSNDQSVTVTCPNIEGGGVIPTNLSEFEHFIPDSVTSDPECKVWLYRKEQTLCRAYHFFNKATAFTADVDDTERRDYYRQATIELVNTIFDEPIVAGDGFPITAEYRINGPSACASAVFPSIPLKYYRRIKLQALELYKKVQENYVQYMVAMADFSRSESGNAREYSRNIWGSRDEFASFMSIRGAHRAEGLAYLIGADVNYLNRLFQHEPSHGQHHIFEYCNSEHIPISTVHRFSVHDCNKRIIVDLPGCPVDGANDRVQNAINVLRKFGIPSNNLQSYMQVGTSIASSMLEVVNTERQSDGLDAFANVGEMNVAFSVDETSLSLASQYLSKEWRVFLYDHWLEEIGGVTVIKGFNGVRVDVQPLLVMGKVNTSRLGSDTSDPLHYNWDDDTYIDIPNAPDRPNPAYMYLKHSYFKMLGIARHRMSPSQATWWLPAQPGAHESELLEIYDQSLALIDDEIGIDEVEWDITVNNINVNPPGLFTHTDTYTLNAIVKLPRGTAPNGASSVDVIYGRQHGGTARPDDFDGLRCALFGKVADAECSLANFRVANLSTAQCDSGYVCRSFNLTYQVHVSGGTSTQFYTRPVIVLVDGKPVDLIILNNSKFWYSVGVGDNFRLRNQASSLVRERVDKITRRKTNECTEPQNNSLGMSSDLVPPVEAEIISNSNLYEDSFVYYLERAKSAAQHASSKVLEATQHELLEVSYQNEVDNAQAAALNRLEQICGQGLDTCTTNKNDYHLGNCADVGLPLYLVPSPTGTLECNSSPPTVANKGDIRTMGEWATCQGNKLQLEAGKILVVDLPVPIAGNPTDTSGLVLAYDGEYLTALLSVSSGLIDIKQGVEGMSQSMRDIGNIAEVIYSRIKEDEVKGLAAFFNGLVKFVGTVGPLVATVATAGAGAAIAVASLIGQGLELKATSQSTNAQVSAELREGIIEIEGKLNSIKQYYNTMKQGAIATQQAIQLVKALELEQQQTKNDAERMEYNALRELVGTNFDQSDSGAVLKNYRTLFNHKHEQALKAIRRSQKMAFIARRALEFKLGVDLRSERSQGIVVDPPYLWVDTLYQLYDPHGIYLDDAVSSYVLKLEDYLYGYPFDHPFAAESDVAIISLRDDIFNVKNSETCKVEILNGNHAIQSEEISDWPFRPACDTQVIPDVADGALLPARKTADVFINNSSLYAIISLDSEIDTSAISMPNSEISAFASIYAKRYDSSGTAHVMPSLVGTYRKIQGDFVTETVVRSGPFVTLNDDQWVRVIVDDVFRAPEAHEYLSLRYEYYVVGSTYQWGALLTIKEESPTDWSVYRRTPEYEAAQGCYYHQWQDPYTNNWEDGYFPTVPLSVERMRKRFKVKCIDWDYAMEAESPAVCGGSEFLEYFETDFAITLDGIENGKVLKQDQFAVGNYNYRMNGVAINLVGSNVKDCSLDPGGGTACLQNQFIPYDLLHGGEVIVRDYQGKDFFFTIPTGAIHSGKAIASERLLTSPLSQTNQLLVQQYFKQEFVGRPLQGNYTLRIYNTLGLRWNNVEDVQIYMDYRYWSPFENP